ncbi:type II toxin-antitoxin system YafQ family toxin [Levilactobacillus lindianensis]|uniref:type II toxin-antitoxin system YafQ family toxin n=1 Tax=Levilactobacillus lindianensis TaxID=2486018 RepID=UPI000F747FBF|nr:type II toxin-antitoxin system YafQ family toxin [Levilactobacillus lindianensis]
MLDEVRLEKTFVKRMDSLSNLFQISNEEATEIRDTIIDTIELLANGEELPDVYSDHELSQDPWTGYREFHVMDDMLVIYYKIEVKKRLRMVMITTHEELSSGKQV